VTERYLREPGAGERKLGQRWALPQIYHGNLHGITAALKDAFDASCDSPVEQRVWSIHPNNLRNLLAIYADGERVWSPSDIGE
jgi:hypothetical protein